MSGGWREWLSPNSSFGLEQIDNTGALLAVALVGSLITSFWIALLYRRFYADRGTGSEIHRAFPLLGPAVTAIFIAVQFSLPLSLGLLGALSIVRFRTPIKEGEEIGFILLVVAVSLSWAILNLQLLLILLLVTLVGLWLASRLRLFNAVEGDALLVMTVPAEEYARHGDALLGALDRAAPSGRIDSITEGDGEAVLTMRFSRLDPKHWSELRRSLAEITPHASPSVYFARRPAS